MAGYRSILLFKSLERLHPSGTHSLGSAQFIACKVVAIANLLLNRALNVAKGELWIAPTRPGERMKQEPKPVSIRCEPCRIEPRGIVCSLCGGRDYVEFLREYRVDALLRNPTALHNPMRRAGSPQHGRYFRCSAQCGAYGAPWRDAISASGALNRPRRRLGGRTASIASSFSDGSTRR